MSPLLMLLLLCNMAGAGISVMPPQHRLFLKGGSQGQGSGAVKNSLLSKLGDRGEEPHGDERVSEKGIGEGDNDAMSDGSEELSGAKFITPSWSGDSEALKARWKLKEALKRVKPVRLQCASSPATRQDQDLQRAAASSCAVEHSCSGVHDASRQSDVVSAGGSDGARHSGDNMYYGKKNSAQDSGMHWGAQDGVEHSGVASTGPRPHNTSIQSHGLDLSLNNETDIRAYGASALRVDYSPRLKSEMQLPDVPRTGLQEVLAKRMELLAKVREAQVDGEGQTHRFSSGDSHGGLSNQRKNLISQLVEHQTAVLLAINSSSTAANYDEEKMLDGANSGENMTLRDHVLQQEISMCEKDPTLQDYLEVSPFTLAVAMMRSMGWRGDTESLQPSAQDIRDIKFLSIDDKELSGEQKGGNGKRNWKGGKAGKVRKGEMGDYERLVKAMEEDQKDQDDDWVDRTDDPFPILLKLAEEEGPDFVENSNWVSSEEGTAFSPDMFAGEKRGIKRLQDDSKITVTAMEGGVDDKSSRFDQAMAGVDDDEFIDETDTGDGDGARLAKDAQGGGRMKPFWWMEGEWGGEEEPGEEWGNGGQGISFV